MEAWLILHYSIVLFYNTYYDSNKSLDVYIFHNMFIWVISVNTIFFINLVKFKIVIFVPRVRNRRGKGKVLYL
jgi:hypothetical protein